MAKVLAVCISDIKGVPKRNIGRAELVEDYGIDGDAHAGSWHRQVSLLSSEKINEFDANIEFGAFGENIVADGIDFRTLPIGTHLRAGKALLEITQIGKQCHDRCGIYDRMGDCIMPREGVFAKVLIGGEICIGDDIYVGE